MDTLDSVNSSVLSFWHRNLTVMMIMMMTHSAVCAADSETLMCRMHSKPDKRRRWDDCWLIEQRAWS